MLKIFIWRLLYHLFCLLKATGYRGQSVNYFAYGANLDPKVLIRRNIAPLDRRDYRLPNYQLRFNHKIPFEGAAMASIEPKNGNLVPGTIYKISKIDELRLDCMEAHLIFNRYGKVIISDDLATEPFYFYSTNCPAEGLKPTKTYLDKLLTGYKLNSQTPANFFQSLANVESIERLSTKNPPEFLIENYDCFTPVFRKSLVAYDKFCVKIFAALIFKPSFFERFF